MKNEDDTNDDSTSRSTSSQVVPLLLVPLSTTEREMVKKMCKVADHIVHDGHHHSTRRSSASLLPLFDANFVRQSRNERFAWFRRQCEYERIAAMVLASTSKSPHSTIAAITTTAGCQQEQPEEERVDHTRRYDLAFFLRNVFSILLHILIMIFTGLS